MAWPEARPETYDADKYWNVTTQSWTATRMGGRGSDVGYVLAISDNDDVGVLYYRVV